MRLLLFNLATDADDPILGFTTRWISALAERAEFVHVITMRAGRIELPSNVRVYSVGKEKGYSEARRALEFYRLLFLITRDGSIDACFSHMMPLFSVLAAPLLKAQGIPIVTWYAHPSLTRTLKLAHLCSDHMVTGLATSYPYKRDKLLQVGHGIDVDTFSPEDSRPAKHPAVILCVGRLSPVKGHATLLTAAKLLRERHIKPFRVVIVGASESPQSNRYVQSLHKQVSELGLEDIVSIEPPTSIAGLPVWYRGCTVHVNLTPKGFADKVALEAMSCGRPSLVANEGFRETLGKFEDYLLFRHGDVQDLAEKLQFILDLSEHDRAQIGRYLHERVVRFHSLNTLAHRLVDLLEHPKRYQSESIPKQAGHNQ